MTRTTTRSATNKTATNKTDPGKADSSGQAPASPGPQLSAAMRASNLRFVVAMPLFFLVMFPLCYITALHLPVPQHLPVAVVGTGAAGLIAAVGPKLGDKVDLIPVGSPGQAHTMILDQTVKAAYVPAPSGQSAHMLLAGADGRLISQLVPTIFRPIAAGLGNSGLQVEDVAPLAAGDGNGIGLMFFMLILCILGYLFANILGTAAFFLPLRQRLLLCAGLALLAPTVLWAFMGAWLGILVGSPGQIVALIAIGAVANYTIALLTTGAVTFLGKWAIFPCMLVFIFLNIPSSNSAYPAEIVPAFFGGISHVHLGAATVGAIRSVLYLHGHDLAPHLVTMAIWLAVALVVITAAIYYRHRSARKHSSNTGSDQPKQAGTDTDDPTEQPTAAAVATAGTVGAGPRRVLQGRVAGEDNQPVPNALVTLITTAGAQIGRVRTDDTGRFAVTDLEHGSYTLLVAATGHEPTAHTALLSGHLHPANEDLGTLHLRESAIVGQ